jgi:hypothetical protein
LVSFRKPTIVMVPLTRDRLQLTIAAPVEYDRYTISFSSKTHSLEVPGLGIDHKPYGQRVL